MTETKCEHCHAELAPQTKRRGAPRRFCSDRCRARPYVARGANSPATTRKRRKALGNRGAKERGEPLDLLRGAADIADFMFDDPDERRKIYGANG